MFKIVGSLIITPLLMCMLVCTPPEKAAYNTVVSAKAYLDNTKKLHPECPTANTTLCTNITRAVAAKDLLIDAAEIYCSGPAFETGGTCQPPVKGTPAYDQAVAKLNAAIAGYNQAATDLKGAK